MRPPLVAAMALVAITAVTSPLPAAAPERRADAPERRADAPDFAALDVITYRPPKPAPPFALPDLAGKTVRLEDFRGRFLLLFFWATW